jgi:hypothetical protein
VRPARSDDAIWCLLVIARAIAHLLHLQLDRTYTSTADQRPPEHA